MLQKACPNASIAAGLAALLTLYVTASQFLTASAVQVEVPPVAALDRGRLLNVAQPRRHQHHGRQQHQRDVPNRPWWCRVGLGWVGLGFNPVDSRWSGTPPHPPTPLLRIPPTPKRAPPNTAPHVSRGPPSGGPSGIVDLMAGSANSSAMATPTSSPSTGLGLMITMSMATCSWLWVVVGRLIGWRGWVDWVGGEVLLWVGSVCIEQSFPLVCCKRYLL